MAPATVSAPSRRGVGADGPEESGSRTGVIAIGAVAAGIVAFVVGLSSGGGSSLASATGDGFVLKAPSGWTATGAVPDAVLGRGTVALAPAGAGGAATISAARMPASRAFGIARERGGMAEAVTLAEGEGLRYGKALYVVPTGADAVVVSCSTGAAALAACPEVAGSVDVTRGAVADSGPNEGAGVLRDALTKLRAKLKNPAFDLQQAKTANAQSESAGDLAAAYRSAAGAVRQAPVGALAEPARNSFASALRAVGNGWGRYAAAAKAGDAAGTHSASGAIASARGRIAKTQAALAQAGYATRRGG